MPVEQTVRGVVLRRRDSGESDASITLLSAELGKFDLVARGAKKPTSRLKGVAEPLSAGTYTFAKGKARKFVTQAQPERGFPLLRSDYDRLNIALAFAELVGEVAPYEEPSDELYELVVTCLRFIESHPKPVVALVWCETELLKLTGFLPSFAICTVSGESVQEAEPYISPSSGGYITFHSANNFRDRVKTKAEILYGLNAISQLAAPPNNLKYAQETLSLLTHFWQHITESKLPSRLNLLKAISNQR